MGQRDADLRVHVHRKARAVEAPRRRRAAPDVRDAEILHRDPDDAAVTRRRRDRRLRCLDSGTDHGRVDALLNRRLLAGHPRSRLLAQDLLAARLLLLQLLDLVANGPEELLPFREPGLDLTLGGSPGGDDLLLARASTLQPLAANRDLGAEPLDLLQHLSVLLGHAVDRVEPVDEVLEARAAQEDLERRHRVPADVEVAQPARQTALGDLEVAAGDAHLAVIRAQVGLDRIELDRGGVVRLDGLSELCVERLDVGQHLLGFGPLVLDAVGKGGTSPDQRDADGDGKKPHKGHTTTRQAGLRCAQPRAHREGPVRHWRGSLPGSPDARNRQLRRSRPKKWLQNRVSVRLQRRESSDTVTRRCSGNSQPRDLRSCSSSVRYSGCPQRGSARAPTRSAPAAPSSAPQSSRRGSSCSPSSPSSPGPRRRWPASSRALRSWSVSAHRRAGTWPRLGARWPRRRSGWPTWCARSTCPTGPTCSPVFLGAASLEDAIDGVDSLHRAADATSGVLDEARAARVRVAALLQRQTTRRG